MNHTESWRLNMLNLKLLHWPSLLLLLALCLFQQALNRQPEQTWVEPAVFVNPLRDALLHANRRSSFSFISRFPHLELVLTIPILVIEVEGGGEDKPLVRFGLGLEENIASLVLPASHEEGEHEVEQD